MSTASTTSAPLRGLAWSLRKTDALAKTRTQFFQRLSATTQKNSHARSHRPRSFSIMTRWPSQAHQMETCASLRTHSVLCSLALSASTRPDKESTLSRRHRLLGVSSHESSFLRRRCCPSCVTYLLSLATPLVTFATRALPGQEIAQPVQRGPAMPKHARPTPMCSALCRASPRPCLLLHDALLKALARMCKNEERSISAMLLTSL